MSADLVKRLRHVSNMINMGERISWGQETSAMDEAANRIEALERKLDEAIIAGIRIAILVPIEDVPEAIAKARQDLTSASAFDA